MSRISDRHFMYGTYFVLFMPLTSHDWACDGDMAAFTIDVPCKGKYLIDFFDKRKNRGQILLIVDRKKVCASKVTHLGDDFCVFQEICASETQDAQVDGSLRCC